MDQPSKIVPYDGGDELYGRAQIGFGLYKILKSKNLNRRAIADILAISEAEVSHFMNRHFSRLTTDKLIGFLKRLDWKVTIEVNAHRPGEPYQIIEFYSWIPCSPFAAH